MGWLIKENVNVPGAGAKSNERSSERTRSMSMEPEPEFVPEPVTCPSCDWFGMSDDCRQNYCPDCGRRVILERKE